MENSSPNLALDLHARLIRDGRSPSSGLPTFPPPLAVLVPVSRPARRAGWLSVCEALPGTPQEASGCPHRDPLVGPAALF